MPLFVLHSQGHINQENIVFPSRIESGTKESTPLYDLFLSFPAGMEDQR